jgi:hypothetical protein
MHNKQSRSAPFTFGLIFGILCMIYLPEYVQPYIPESIAGQKTVLKGTVVAKEKRGEILLLTVSTPEGALLATFVQKTDEVGLLINEKDEIQFALPNYMPFIEDPKIIRVVKEQQAVPAPADVPAETAAALNRPAGKSTKEIRSRHKVKPQTSAPAPASIREVKPPDLGNSVPPANAEKPEQ